VAHYMFNIQLNNLYEKNIPYAWKLPLKRGLLSFIKNDSG
jgi:hypothetical protein